MRWRRPRPKRSGGAVTGQAWTAEDVATLRQAVGRSPSSLTPAPCTLEVQGHSASLHEAAGDDLDRRDPEGRDRGLSCGAALTNLALAIRNTGWAIEIRRELAASESEISEDEGAGYGRVVITVTCTHRQAPTATEGQRFRAIPRRHSYRHPFHSRELSHLAREALEAASRSPAVASRWVTRSQAGELADLLGEAARSHRRDGLFHRDVAMWTVPRNGPATGGWGGPRSDEAETGHTSVAGSSPPVPRLPDRDDLASRIAEESILGLSTPSDTHEDHINAGETMQHAWLAATSLGLAASVIVRPLHGSRFRTALRDRLAMPGEPQALVRFGYPTVVPGQRRS